MVRSPIFKPKNLQLTPSVASFPNTQPLLPTVDLGVWHSSEIGLIFGTYSSTNSTAQQSALSKAMQGAWAAFAKNPTRGPGWNPVGTYDGVDLAILGADGSSGVKMAQPGEVDRKCALFAPFYALMGSVS
jgi:carboxylesterase type B